MEQEYQIQSDEMAERIYAARKRAIIVWLVVIALIWIDFVSIFYLLAEKEYPPTAYFVFRITSVVLAAFVLFFWVLRKIYRMLYTPQIIVADTVLILGFGEFIMNWEDINRVDIPKNDFTIFKRREFSKCGGHILGT